MRRTNPPATPPTPPPSPRVLREFDFAFLTPDQAARLTMPVKLIWGALDPVIPGANRTRLAERLPNATLVVLPRTWHRPQTERPTEVARILSAFVQCDRPRPPVDRPLAERRLSA